MEMPRPTEEHERLKALAGEWTGAETLHPTPMAPDGGRRTSRTTARMDLDGFFLIMEYEQYDENGKVSHRGHGVYGWDRRQQKYTFHWFDVMGGDFGAPALGTWDGDKLSFQVQHHMGHSRYVYSFTGDGAYGFTIEFSQDGKEWLLFLEGKYRRAS